MAIISNATTIADSGAFSVSLGSMVHIKTLTASSSATLSFVHGTDGVVLDSTYPIYKFEFINCHPATNSANFTFNGSTDSGSNYNVTKTTTFFEAYHNEANTDANLQYNNTRDLAQSTSFQQIVTQISNANDSNCGGTLTLFNPSSTTFVKHFIARTNGMTFGTYSHEGYTAGYFNTTSALNAFQFKMSSGNIDDGKIKLYGIKDS